MTAEASHALMAREISAQPDILRALLEPVAAAASAQRLPRDRDVWIFGCGDGLYAGLSVAHLARQGGYRPRAVSSAELLWDAEPRPGDPCIGLSISGGTRRTVEAMARARSLGAWTLAVTIRPDSDLARAAEATLTLPYEPITRKTPHSLDHAVSLLALALLFGTGREEAAAEIGRLGGTIEAMGSAAAAVAAALDPGARIFLLGSGAARGAAEYGAAKLHEAGGVVGMALEAENGCHGANFVMRRGDHAVLLGAGGPGDRRTADLRPGLERLGLSVSEAGFRRTPFGALFETAIWCQCLCLALARERGLDVTAPGAGGDAAAVQAEWFAWRADAG
jgi:fructoselysine-6-P-deglycase FrlB-like protein